MSTKTWSETETHFAAFWPASSGAAEAGMFYDRTTGAMTVGMRSLTRQKWMTAPVRYTPPAIQDMDDWQAAVEAHAQNG